MSGIYYLKFIVRNISADSDNAYLYQFEFAVDETWSALPVGQGGLFGKLCVFHENAHSFQVRAQGTKGRAIAVVNIRELVHQEKGIVHLGFLLEAEPHDIVYTAELAFEVGRLRLPPATLSAATQTEVTQRHANSQTSQTIVRSVECQANDRSASVAKTVAVSEAQTQTDDPSRVPLSNEQKRLLIALFALIVLKVQMKMEEMANAKNTQTVTKVCPRCSRKTKEEESQKQNELKGKLASVAKAYRAMSRPASSTSARRWMKNEHPTDPEPHHVSRTRPTRKHKASVAVAQQPTVPREGKRTSSDLLHLYALATPPIRREEMSVPIVPTNEDLMLSDGSADERDDGLQELPSSAASSPSKKPVRKNNESASTSRAESASSSSRSHASTSSTDSSSSSDGSSKGSNSSSQSSSATSTSKSSESKSKHSTSSSISEAIPSSSTSKHSSIRSQQPSPTSAYLSNLRQEVLNDRSTSKR